MSRRRSNPGQLIVCQDGARRGFSRSGVSVARQPYAPLIAVVAALHRGRAFTFALPQGFSSMRRCRNIDLFDSQRGEIGTSTATVSQCRHAIFYGCSGGRLHQLSLKLGSADFGARIGDCDSRTSATIWQLVAGGLTSCRARPMAPRHWSDGLEQVFPEWRDGRQGAIPPALSTAQAPAAGSQPAVPYQSAAASRRRHRTRPPVDHARRMCRPAPAAACSTGFGATQHTRARTTEAPRRATPRSRRSSTRSSMTVPRPDDLLFSRRLRARSFNYLRSFTSAFTWGGSQTVGHHQPTTPGQAMVTGTARRRYARGALWRRSPFQISFSATPT